MFRRRPKGGAWPSWAERFGIRGARQIAHDVATVVSHLPRRDRFIVDLGSARLLRPELSLPAYFGLLPSSGTAPIYNFFDRTAGGLGWRGTVTRRAQRDWRGGDLAYDEHDGTDFVCPPCTPVVAAAPGVVVATRDNWLRGGLTVCVDHGGGVVTQYTHLAARVAELGQPVERGEVIALSGTSGIDLTQFFPLVPPHVHFMVWERGMPVDPYIAPDDAPHPATWRRPNDPDAAARALADDPSPSTLARDADAGAIDRVARRCLDPRIQSEINAAPSDAARAAIMEDSFHHESWVWPADVRGTRLRTSTTTEPVRLTLPLTAELYRDAAAADAFTLRARDSAWNAR